MRRIDELIWHTTATPEGREVSIASIRAFHIHKRGWKDIGYHLVVHLDGSVSPGRPPAQIGSHARGHNRYSLGYAYVGGVAEDGRTPKDTRTPAQIRTMLRLTREAVRDYPLKRISGHRAYSSKACPCFDAEGEYGPLLKEV